LKLKTKRNFPLNAGIWFFLWTKKKAEIKKPYLLKISLLLYPSAIPLPAGNIACLDLCLTENHYFPDEWHKSPHLNQAQGSHLKQLEIGLLSGQNFIFTLFVDKTLTTFQYHNERKIWRMNNVLKHFPTWTYLYWYLVVLLKYHWQKKFLFSFEHKMWVLQQKKYTFLVVTCKKLALFPDIFLYTH